MTVLTFDLAFLGAVALFTGTASSQTASGCCTLTVRAFDPASPDADPNSGSGLGRGAAISNYNFIVNLDNTAPANVSGHPELSNGIPQTESNSPIVAKGDQGHSAVNLPPGRYLISIRALDHKMWGQLVTLSATDVTADIVMTEVSDGKPLPLGSNRIIVFEDNGWTNGAPDPGERGLDGFAIEMYESTGSRVSADYHNKPLCSDPKPGAPSPGSWPNCETDTDGFVQVDNLSPAMYFTKVVAPPGPCNGNPASEWHQTTTIDGGLDLGTPVEEGATGAGPPTALAADLVGNGAKQTINFFGFVCTPFDNMSGSGEITGTARNVQSWAAADDFTYSDPIPNPFVALTDASTDATIYADRGDAGGNFDIQNVPPGTYNLAIWDEQLDYILSFQTVIVGANQTVDVDTPDSRGEPGVGVPRWKGWIDGTVYKDVNGNGRFDEGIDAPISNTDMDQRWRDGSIKEVTFTDSNGYYEYPAAEGGALGKWVINEQGFARFSAYPGPSTHDEVSGAVTPSCAVEFPADPCMPTDLGGGLLTNQLSQPGHRSTVDWGKSDYEPGTPGQIVGVTYFPTTRNEFDAKFQAHEDYEPGIPDVTVYLEGPGADQQPNTSDDVTLNKYVTDHWQQPSDCTLTDFDGSNVTGAYNPLISQHCLENPITGIQTKDGGFDGGYAFADYCPNGFDEGAPYPDDAPCWNSAHNGHVAQDPLVAGTYITHVVMPKAKPGTYGPSDIPCNPDGSSSNPAAQAKFVSGRFGNEAGHETNCLYRIVREDDVNVDLGDTFTPAVPPPDCVGDDHLIDQSTVVQRSPHFGKPGAHAALCDKVLVTLTNGRNFNADFNLMTNFPTDPNGSDDADAHVGDVAVPGRIVGLALNDLVFDTDPASVNFGNNAAAPNLPVGIYARYDDNPDHWRLFTTVTTSALGTYEALLPSTQTWNCPIPQGPCPGMYRFLVNDPGTPTHPNANYDPGFLPGTDYIADVWPGQTDVALDTPMIPNNAGTACQTPSGKPELLQVSKAAVAAADTTAGSRRITIDGAGFGTTPGTVQLTDPRGPGQSRTLGPVLSANPTLAAGGVVSWTDRRIVIQVPTVANSFPAGQKQLLITEDGRTTENGITIHVLGSGYSPTVVNVASPTSGGHQLQNAIDSASTGSLLLLSAGTYYESVIMWKPVKIQGLGPGGTVGARNLLATTPGDPRFAITGTNIDGRFFATYTSSYNATLTAHAPYAGIDANHPALRGADVLVLAKTTTAYSVPTGSTGVFSAARIDGVAMTTGAGNSGAGGVQLQARADNTQITNNVLESNSGTFAGGIGIGQPNVGGTTGSHNFNVSIRFDRVVANGSVAVPGVVGAGGIGIFNGSNTYEVANSVLCSNSTGEPDSAGFGGGISHYGRSPSGWIHDNEIIYNRAIESGGGISIKNQAGTTTQAGTGTVNIDRNVIQTNQSGNDGGGILVSGATGDAINIRNNMINDNLASDTAGALLLHDSANVRIINNTVANNASAASALIGGASDTPRSAGLAVDDAPVPSVLFNNIFWHNQAFTLNANGTLVDRGFIDFGVSAVTGTLTPRYSDLTNGKILVNETLPLGNVPTTGHGNRSGDPNFVEPLTLLFSVSASVADPALALVSIAGVSPQDAGLTGDFHINLPLTPLSARQAAALASPVVDKGSRCSNTPVPATNLAGCSSGGIDAPRGLPSASNPGGGDIDGETRPQRIQQNSTNTPWDLGADESAGTPVVQP